MSPTTTSQLQKLLVEMKQVYEIELGLIAASNSELRGKRVSLHISCDMSYLSLEHEEVKAGNNLGQEITYLNRVPTCCVEILTKI